VLTLRICQVGSVLVKTEARNLAQDSRYFRLVFEGKVDNDFALVGSQTDSELDKPRIHYWWKYALPETVPVEAECIPGRRKVMHEKPAYPVSSFTRDIMIESILVPQPQNRRTSQPGSPGRDRFVVSYHQVVGAGIQSFYFAVKPSQVIIPDSVQVTQPAPFGNECEPSPALVIPENFHVEKFIS